MRSVTEEFVLPYYCKKMATPWRVKEEDRTRFVASPTNQTQRSKCSCKSEVSKKELTCSVCLDSLKDPKLLPCLHTYCKGCLQGILRKSREKSSIKCPECRSVHAIPSGGVDEFPSDMVSANALDFHSLKDKEKITQSISCGMCTEDDPVTTHCPTCSKFLCEFCSKAHKRQVDYRDHKTVSLDDLDSETLKGFERSRRCSRHSGELLKLYCKTCRKLICRDCTLVDHHNHTFGFLKDVRPDIQKQVESSVAVLGMKQKELETHLKFTNDIEKSRKDHSNDLERKLNHAFDSYIATVESHRKRLLKQERKAKERDLKQIWAQKEFIEMKLASIDGSMHYANRLCSCPSDLDMLEMSGEATQQLLSLSEVKWNPLSQLELPTPLVFSAKANFSQNVVGSVNPASLQHFNISISTPTQPNSQQRGDKSGYHMKSYYGQAYYGYSQADYHDQVELGKAVQLVVHLNSNSPASVSSSLIIPSISVTTQQYSKASSVNYVVTRQDDGSWMITVTPLHGGTYTVTASLQQRPTADSEVYSKAAVYDQQYHFTVIGTPKIGARVRRGPNWPRGNNEDGGISNRGIVIRPFFLKKVEEFFNEHQDQKNNRDR